LLSDAFYEGAYEGAFYEGACDIVKEWYIGNYNTVLVTTGG